jgi:hypothetical protein
MSIRSIYVLLILLAQLAPITPFSWDGYPSCATSYLEDAAPPDCYYGDDVEDVQQNYICLCTDTTFLTTAAQWTWQYCGCSILAATASKLGDVCGEEAYGIAMDAAQIIASGDGGQTTCVDPPSTSAAVALPSTTSTPPIPTTLVQEPSQTAKSSTVISSPGSAQTSASPSGDAGGQQSALSPGAIAAIAVIGLIFTVLGTIFTGCMCYG